LLEDGHQKIIFESIKIRGRAAACSAEIKKAQVFTMQENNEIKLEQKGEVTILNIRGDVTSFSEIPLKESYRKVCDQNARKIILKFDKDAYINSGGIALLIQMMYQIKENRQLAAVTGISDHFKKIFNMVGITKFADIFDSVDEALEGLG
jgi:anti-anti-sigma factor